MDEWDIPKPGTAIAEAPNGIAEIHELHDEQPRLGAGALRRLQRLANRVEGATEVAQAALGAHQVARDAYEQAFTAACEDTGIAIPPGPNDVDIDWYSGAVKFRPRPS
jgi:hypothetical protein